MDRVVTYELFGEERKVVIHGASSDAQARDLFTTELAKFRITNIVGVNAKPTPKTSIWSLMADGFRFPKLSKNVQPTQ